MWEIDLWENYNPYFGLRFVYWSICWQRPLYNSTTWFCLLVTVMDHTFINSIHMWKRKSLGGFKTALYSQCKMKSGICEQNNSETLMLQHLRINTLLYHLPSSSASPGNISYIRLWCRRIISSYLKLILSFVQTRHPCTVQWRWWSFFNQTYISRNQKVLTLVYVRSKSQQQLLKEVNKSQSVLVSYCYAFINHCTSNLWKWAKIPALQMKHSCATLFCFTV